MPETDLDQDEYWDEEDTPRPLTWGDQIREFARKLAPIYRRAQWRWNVPAPEHIPNDFEIARTIASLVMDLMPYQVGGYHSNSTGRLIVTRNGRTLTVGLTEGTYQESLVLNETEDAQNG